MGIDAEMGTEADDTDLEKSRAGTIFAIDHGVNGDETCSEDIKLALGLEGTGSDAAASKEGDETDDGLEGESLA